MAYILLILSVLTMFIIDERGKHGLNKSKVFMFTFLIVLCFSGFRYYVGYDYNNYSLWLNELPYHKLSRMLREPLNYLVMIVAHYFLKHQSFFLINSIITISLIFYTIKENSKDWKLSVWIFLMFPLFFLNSLSIVRFYTALSITFYGYKYIKASDFKKYSLCVFIAFLFHNSAFIALPIYFLHNFEMNIKKIFMAVAGILLAIPIIKIFVIEFFPRFSYVFEGGTPIAGNKTILVIIFIVFLSIMFRNKITSDQSRRTLYNIIVFGLVNNLIFYKFDVLGYRGSLYFYIYLVLFIPSLIELLPTSYIKITRISIYLIMIPMFAYMVYVGGDFYSPYKVRFEIVYKSDQVDLIKGGNPIEASECYCPYI